MTREGVTSEEKEDRSERQDDSDGWGAERGGKESGKLTFDDATIGKALRRSMKTNAVEGAMGICGMVRGRKRMSPERKVKEIAFAREGGRRVGRIGFEGSKGGLMSDRDLKEKRRT